MFHFIGNPTCSARTSDTEARVSSAPDLETFQDCQSTDPRYCAECANVRSDSERYAELRKLVEAWQEAHRQHDQARTTAPETEGWLKHWLNFCDAQKPLLDWSHR